MKIRKDICTKNKTECTSFESMLQLSELDELYDYKVTLRSVITNEQYETIRNQIVELKPRVIFELAWEAYMLRSEIKNLLSNQILVSDDGKSIAIQIVNRKGEKINRTIQDPESIKDIITLKNQTNKNQHFLQTDKKVTGKGVFPITNIIEVLRSGLLGIKYDDKYVSDLTIEDIRKSKRIYLYHKVNTGELESKEIAWIIGKNRNMYGEHFDQILARMVYGD